MVRITEIRERSIPISRYADGAIPSGGLTTSIVAITTDVVRDGRPVIGYGFSSIGRFAQSGLIRERFAPRLLAADGSLHNNADSSNIDPLRAWNVMLAREKPGGHGERCVAVGTLDMALWDLASKVEDLPLHAFIRKVLGEPISRSPRVNVYAGGGYPYPADDVERLVQETKGIIELGYTHMKIKIGAGSIARDVERIDAASSVLGSPSRLAVDAMNAFDATGALRAAEALKDIGLWWFEDVCDPLDFSTLASVAAKYSGPIAAGEALFSEREANLLARHGGLRPDRDILLFDPVHAYGIPGYLSIVARMAAHGWPRSAFWPHGGHLFSLHVAGALDLGGCEVNPLSFQPFGGVADDMRVVDGRVQLGDAAGIGFEQKASVAQLFETLDASDRVEPL